ncbi:MAG: hypothetical protein ACYCW6_02395 [Candidatus Xenobia bacterium]
MSNLRHLALTIGIAATLFGTAHAGAVGRIVRPASSAPAPAPPPAASAPASAPAPRLASPPPAPAPGPAATITPTSLAAFANGPTLASLIATVLAGPGRGSVVQVNVVPGPNFSALNLKQIRTTSCVFVPDQIPAGALLFEIDEHLVKGAKQPLQIVTSPKDLIPILHSLGVGPLAPGGVASLIFNSGPALTGTTGTPFEFGGNTETTVGQLIQAAAIAASQHR